MALASPARTLPSRPPSSDAHRLSELLRQADAGGSLDPHDIVSLTQSPDRATGGLAKRLLAVVLLDAARKDAARLLGEACEDLDYRYPIVLSEALQHAEALGRRDDVFNLQVRAASSLANRGECVPALVQLLNAAMTDFRHGARRLNDPDSLRRMIATYERAAQSAASVAQIAPAPRVQRRSPPDGPLRMAHIVCQLVDGGHAPSRCAETLLKFADRERFKTYLFVTEALAHHQEHTAQTAASGWSDQRGAGLIQRFERDLCVPVILPKSRRSCVSAAAELHVRMAELRIDVAFFHGSIATPTDWLLCAWHAAPWQFDRAFGVPLHCPAVDYQFFEFEETMEQLAFLFRERGIPYGYSPFGGVDFSHVTDATPFSRDELGIPGDHVVLGTIGNHLPKRMSPAFCRTVAGIMRAHPRTTYLVVGPGPFDAQRQVFGADLCGDGGPRSRVKFVGVTDRSDRMTQTFDIYLNEYPDGGGMSVCEAMAAGKPVVCMLAGTSSLAMVGATYVGPDHLIQPASDENYARRLANLIVDVDGRGTLGRALQQRYESDFSGRKWVADMTERIWQTIHGPSAR